MSVTSERCALSTSERIWIKPAKEKGGLDQLVILTLPQLFSMDVKQEINPKVYIFTLPHSFFIAALSEASEKLTIRVTLVQEVGIDIMV